MRAKWGRALLITILASICILIMDTGTCFYALADDDATVIGSSSVVGGKAVVMIDSTALSVPEPTVIEEDTSVEEYVPSIQPIRNGKLVDAAYYKRSSLTEYNFPDSEITEIGDFAFGRSGLQAVVIPDSVTKIGYGAFYHCEQLSQVEIPDSVTEIAPYAFEESAWLKNWREEQQENVAKGKESFLIVGDGILLAYEGNKQSVILPDTIKRIAGNAFYQNKQIKSLLLPSSLLEIGESAFEDCSSLAKVTGGKNVKIIRDKAFAGCPISEILLSEQLEQIGYHVYDYPGAVISFQGNSLPKMIYSERATRLTNESYREHTFEGAVIAVIKKNVKNLKGTVLDSDNYGFSGVVCQLEANRVSDREGKLTVIQVNDRVEECPSTIRLSGRSYRITDSAGLITKSRDSIFPAGLTMRCLASSLKPQNLVSAFLTEPFSDSLELCVEEDKSVKEKLSEAYLHTYGQAISQEHYAYSLTLTDRNCQIPIERLGTNCLTITVPVPKKLDIDSLHVAMLDQNDLLQEITYSVAGSGEATRITFQTERITPIILY